MFQELLGQIMIWARAIEVSHGNSDERSPGLAVHTRNLTQPEIDPALDQARPCPRPGNHHRELPLPHEIFCLAVRATLWQDASLDQRDDLRQRVDDPGSCNAHRFQVVAGAVLSKYIASVASEDPPHVERAPRIPEDGDHPRTLTFYFLTYRSKL